MLDPVFIDNIKANAETLRNSAMMLYDLTQTMTANETDKEIARKIVSVEGYLELVKNARRDTNKARKEIAEALNVDHGILEPKAEG